MIATTFRYINLKWLIVICFWTLLYVSAKLFLKHSWLGPLSAVLVWAAVVALVVNYGLALLKCRTDEGRLTLSNRGYPRWFLRFAYDDRAPDSPHKSRPNAPRSQSS